MISSYDVHLVSKYNLQPHQFVLDESKILHIRFANRTFDTVVPWFLSILMNEFSKILHIRFANRTFDTVVPWFLSILMNEFL